MFIIAYVMGIYLGNGEILIQDQSFYPLLSGEPTLTFSSREKCEAHLLSTAKELSEYYGDTQEIKFNSLGHLIVTRNQRDWFDSAECLEIIPNE